MAAAGYVATSLTPGMATGASALWVAQHRPDPASVYALNNLRTFSHQMSLMMWAAFFGAVAVSALVGRTLPRWLSLWAAAVGPALVLGVAGAKDHWHDLASMIGLVWVVAASVWLLRARTGQPAARNRSLQQTSA
jgi:hypothetical protein